MKNKGSKSIKISTLCTMSVIALFVVLALRFAQVLTIVDSETGFYTKSSALTMIYYVLLAVMIVASIVCAFLSKQVNEFNPNGYKSKESIFSLLAALAFGFDTIAAALVFSGENTDQSSIKLTIITAVFRIVFDILSLFYFIFIFSDERKGSAKASGKKLLALAPACWAVVRLIELFTSKISYVRVSDLLLEIIYLALFALFFVNFAQIKSGVYSEGNSWKAFAYGAPAAIIALSVFCVRFVLSFGDKWPIYTGEYSYVVADLSVSLFILAFLFGKKNYISAETVKEDGKSEPIPNAGEDKE